MKENKNNNFVLTGVVAILIGGLAFFGGMQYQKSKIKTFRPGQMADFQGMTRNGIPATGNRQTRIGGNEPVMGEITEMDENTITVKTQDGSNKIIIYSDSTTVNKTSEGSKTDLKIGEQIMVMGKAETDGSVTANTISLGGNFLQRMPNREMNPEMTENMPN